MEALDPEQLSHWSEVISFPWEWVEVDRSPVDRLADIDYNIIKLGYGGVAYFISSAVYRSLDILEAISQDAEIQVFRFEPNVHIFNVRTIVSDKVEAVRVASMEECIRLLEKYSMELLI